jgi:hypothetical protein
MKTHGQRILRVYYAATPIFVLLDLLWHWNIRTVGLESVPVLKYGYYVACTGCAVLGFLKPGLSAAIGLVESSTNLVALVLGVAVPIYVTMPQAIDGADIANPLTPFAVTNFVLTGSMLLVAFYSNPLVRNQRGAVK